MQHRNKLRSALIGAMLLTISLGTAAQAISVGNGGSQPPAQYNSTFPTLTTGQNTYEQTDSRGRLIVSPSSFPSWQPIVAGTAIPIVGATTIPVHEVGTATVTGTVSVGNLPAAQGVVPVPSASPFPVTPATTFPVSGSLGVNNFPTQFGVVPVPSASPFNVNCTNCSGGGSAGVYNTTLPTYTNGQTVVPQYDANGRAIVAPFTISLPSPLPIAYQYNSALPVLSNGAFSAPQVDINGLPILSPQTNIQVGNGIYWQDPIPLANGQVTQVRTNALGETIVAASTPLPVTVAQVGTLTDRHSQIAVASGSQMLFPQDATRHGYLLQATNCDEWLNLLGNPATAAPPSFKVASGTSFTSPPYFPAQNPVQIYAASTACVFSVVTW